ncbi:MAG: hypothetical protein VCD00_19240 [Candidatus Hydrogenedentota bacterium]
MIISCKTCKKIHSDGKWTNEFSQDKKVGYYTFCPTCLSDINDGHETFNSPAGLPSTYITAN